MRLWRAGLHFYVTGIIILTFGIALTILSELGASPFDSLLVGLHRTFGLTVGSWEIVVGFTMVVGNALAEKKKPEYLALVTSFLTGLGIDMWLFSLENLVAPETWMGAYTALFAGIIFIGLGVAFYLQSNFAPNPMDRSMLVLSKRTGWSVTYSRALISAALVVLAYLFGGAIGIGTLINALVSGVLISLFLPYVKTLKQSKQHNHLVP